MSLMCKIHAFFQDLQYTFHCLFQYIYLTTGIVQVYLELLLILSKNKFMYRLCMSM